MLEFKFSNAKWSQDSDGTWLSILAENPARIKAFVQEAAGKPYSAVFKQWRKKRTLDANALCWALCSEIGNVYRQSKEEVYLDMLRHYGQSSIILMYANIDPAMFFKYFDKDGDGWIDDTEAAYYKVYVGSSEYDSEEMSILLDGIVNTAKSLDIPVMSASEIDLLKDDWSKKDECSSVDGQAGSRPGA